MTRTADIAATDPVTRMARDIRAVTQDKGDCLEADMRLKGWTDDEIRTHRQDALAMVRRWQDRDEAASALDRAAAHTVTPASARMATAQVGTARSHLDYVTTKLAAAGAGRDRKAPAPRAIDALDKAIDLLVATRANLTGQPWAPKAPAATRAAA